MDPGSFICCRFLRIFSVFETGTGSSHQFRQYRKHDRNLCWMGVREEVSCPVFRTEMQCELSLEKRGVGENIIKKRCALYRTKNEREYNFGRIVTSKISSTPV